jgi:hypothetical protein
MQTFIIVQVVAPSISSSEGILMLHSELDAQLLNGLNIMLAGKLIPQGQKRSEPRSVTRECTTISSTAARM